MSDDDDLTDMQRAALTLLHQVDVKMRALIATAPDSAAALMNGLDELLARIERAEEPD